MPGRGLQSLLSFPGPPTDVALNVLFALGGGGGGGVGDTDLSRWGANGRGGAMPLGGSFSMEGVGTQNWGSLGMGWKEVGLCGNLDWSFDGDGMTSAPGVADRRGADPRVDLKRYPEVETPPGMVRRFCAPMAGIGTGQHISGDDMEFVSSTIDNGVISALQSRSSVIHTRMLSSKPGNRCIFMTLFRRRQRGSLR
ncbi:hypothetical protein EYF80_003479 [Liparis tanakae]|uniref:Uncharacterized protein n=1 Tax=Liparis tanakae TaxID=230148 RepID=A0A4Z2J9D5_9TELE|nr:hypothetical protein EYF80_003479 [Liparis tanakae]